jgi:hypothetical protein
LLLTQFANWRFIPIPALEDRELIEIGASNCGIKRWKPNLTPLDVQSADTGLQSTTSRSFELAIDQFPSYQARQVILHGARAIG